MQQRQPRVGDIVDDYCPRERRISDHAIVAMVTDAIRLVRCTTCDAEHEYKQAKVPVSRKRKVTAQVAPPASSASSAPDPQAEGALIVDAEADMPAAADAAAQAADEVDPAEPSAAAPSPAEPAVRMPEGSVHRQLIRARLPKVEGQVPVRPIPEFTMHKSGAPGKPFRGKGGRPQHSGPGAGLHRGPKGSGAHGRHAGSDRSQAHGQPGSFAHRGPRGSNGPMGPHTSRGPHGQGGPGRPKKH